MSSSTFSALHVDGYVYASPSKSIARDDLSDSDDDTALMDAYNQAVERYRESHDPNGAVAGATALSPAGATASSPVVGASDSCSGSEGEGAWYSARTSP